VQSFRIPGAVASNHPPGDGNGGSSEFFWLGSGGLDEDGFNMVPDADALNSKYSIFGYIVRDKNQVSFTIHCYAVLKRGGIDRSCIPAVETIL
jgi:cyclophilin family peptidyl-prolyl cis-trans isomerase